MSPFVSKLVQVALTEWGFFGNQRQNLDGTLVRGRQEYDDGPWQRIGDYWKLIGGGYKNLTGKDRGYPWSAAFISFCMHEAGADNRFPPSPGHATYINRAISNALAGKTNEPTFGWRLTDYAPKVGDLIGYWRGETVVTFATAPSIGWYTSHTDIVVEVGPGKLASIGGNVSDSVTRREVKLDAAGKVIDQKEPWFVVIENKM